jgi:hypothetical protein
MTATWGLAATAVVKFTPSEYRSQRFSQRKRRRVTQAYVTRRTLEDLREDIAHYQAKTGSVPADLAELDSVKQRLVLFDEEETDV